MFIDSHVVVKLVASEIKSLGDFDINIMGIPEVLKLTLEKGIQEFRFTSLVAGYGDPVKLPISVEKSPDPTSFYVISKSHDK